ncbi:MAG TPA: hypothetical protein VF331_15855 [Polyangiales bacterium]
MNDAPLCGRTRLERADHWAPLLRGVLACALCAAGCSSSAKHADDMGAADASIHDASIHDAAAPPMGKDGPVELPNGAPGIEFDDIQWAPHLRKVIVPAGRTGSVMLIDPDTSEVSELKGLTKSDKYMVASGFIPVGTRYGSTAATEADRYVAVLDGTAKTLNIFDPATLLRVSSIPLDGPADYVHYVGSTREIWVTRPSASMLDVYSLPKSGTPKPTKLVSIAVSGGPESLVIDETRGRAYTNTLTGGKTYAIDLSTHAIVATYMNSCSYALGVALDETRGFAFVICGENGDSVSLDLNHAGAVLNRQNGGSQANILAYSPSLHHLYSPSGKTSQIFVMDVLDSGKLTLLGKLPGASRGFSAAADDRGHVWVIDPDHGRVIRATDSFASH